MNRLIFVTIALVFSLLLLTGINAQDGITVTDANDDGVVDILDLVYVASHFGESSDPTQTPSPDVNGNEIVNILDLVHCRNDDNRRWRIRNDAIRQYPNFRTWWRFYYT